MLQIVTLIYPLFYQYDKNYQSWWKFDKVMAKQFCTVFFRHGVA